MRAAPDGGVANAKALEVNTSLQDLDLTEFRITEVPRVIAETRVQNRNIAGNAGPGENTHFAKCVFSGWRPLSALWNP